MKTLYLAGPMSNLPDFNYPAFHDAAAQLRVIGYDVENPVENKPPEQTWLAYMRMSLVQISKADGIATLPGWGESKGATIEVQLATDLGLEVKRVKDWIFDADMENRSLTVEASDGSS